MIKLLRFFVLISGINGFIVTQKYSISNVRSQAQRCDIMFYCRIQPKRLLYYVVHELLAKAKFLFRLSSPISLNRCDSAKTYYHCLVESRLCPFDWCHCRLLQVTLTEGQRKSTTFLLTHFNLSGSVEF